MLPILPPFTIALTGGIASGKSAVAHHFHTLGVDVFDADTIARELVARGSAALADIVAAFGKQVLDASGALDRHGLRAIVFADVQARHTLEAILHPLVRARLRECVAQARSPYALLVIPLLVESGHYQWVDRVLAVDTPREMQRERLMARDSIAPELADAMLDAQASREQRLAIADDVIGNTGTLAELDARIDALHAWYLGFVRR
ncbi:MAG: dephospho-CoA kinase [Rhodanobacter sp.]|nr:dephospho-CoA kinase [Rhodanobacter sp.]